MFLLLDGELIPVTNLLDVNGDETDDPELADRFVAGPLPNGQWMSGTFDEFKFSKMN